MTDARREAVSDDVAIARGLLRQMDEEGDGWFGRAASTIRALADRLVQVQASYDADMQHWTQRLATSETTAEQLHAAIADYNDARQQVARLREALRFYADLHAYGISGGTVDRVIQDRGQRAQAALRETGA